MQRLLASLLPISFLWVFASCVMICTDHAAEAQRESVNGSIAEANLLAESDCCPIYNTHLSVLPDRRLSVVGMTREPVESNAGSINLSPHQPTKLFSSLHPPAFERRPLEQSCLLRI